MVDLEKARSNPAEVFKKPSDVLDDKNLSLEDKIDILERWAFDEKEKAVAEEENMPDLAMEDINVLSEVLRCLLELGVEHTDHAPTKHG